MAAVNILPVVLDRKRRIGRRISLGMERTSSCGTLIVGGNGNGAKIARKNGHRRCQSSSVHPVSKDILTTAQKKERRMKTRSFDCTRSFSVEIGNDFDYDWTPPHTPKRKSIDRYENIVDDMVFLDRPVDDEMDDEEPKYLIHPDVEALLENAFNNQVDEPQQPQQQQQQQQQIENNIVVNEFTCQQSALKKCKMDDKSKSIMNNSNNISMKQQRKRRHHRRTASILFKSQDSIEKEMELQAQLLQNDNDQKNVNISDSDHKDLVSLIVQSMEETAAATNNNNSSSSSSSMKRPTTPTLPTILE